MKSLLRMTEQELAEHSAGHGLRLFTAVGLATTGTILALLGMMSRYSTGDDAPLPAMDHPAGQAAWAAAFGAMMLLSGVLVQNVIMKRLQIAAVVSLALHLLICFSIQNIHVNAPFPTTLEAAEDDGGRLSELTLPDYGGMESPNAEPAEWEQPSEVEIREQQQELERQNTEVEVNAEPTEVEQRQTEVAAIENMEARQREAMQNATELEIERQQREQNADAPSQVDRPEVDTAAASEMELEAQQTQQRTEARPEVAQREQVEIERQRETQVDPARVQATRSTQRPQEMAQQQVQPIQRTTANAAAVETRVTETVEVATADAREAARQSRPTETARQTDADLPSRQPSQSDSPTAAQPMQVASVDVNRAAAADANPTAAAPSDGGAASIERSTTAAGQSLSAAQANAQAVQVAAASGASAPSLDASAAAAAVSRGNAASVPTGSAAQGASPAVSRSSSGVTALSSGAVSRRQSSGGAPRLANAAASATQGGTGRSQRSPTQAAGTQAKQVSVAGAAASRSTSGGVLSNTPSEARVSRNRSGLPGRATQGGGTPTVASTSSSRSRPSSVRAGGTSGLTGNATERTATLGNTSSLTGGPSPTTSSTRRPVAAALPAGAHAAEQSGALVVAGPRAAPTGGASGGSLSGPRLASVPRRTAGLPGSSRAASVSRSRPGLPIGISRSTLPTRSAATGARPVLASRSELAGLIRRSAPGIGALPEERISAGFSMRRPDVRREAAKKLGGNDASEAAVERGLEWLARHQFAAGNWSIHDLNCQDHDCRGAGSHQSDTAATGLGLLTFLGAGYTHKSGKYQGVVQRSLNWLTSNQKPNGDLYSDDSEFLWLYSQGMAAIALCEAYGMTKDSSLREPAQKSLDFIIAAQHPTFGGWRYRPRFESDTSVSGWQLMALKSGEMAGLSVPDSVYSGVKRWLDSVEDDSAPGRFRYHPSKPVSVAMTAEGLLMRQYIGAKRSDSDLIAGANYLKARLPRTEERDVYYWYYATQVMFHMQGEHWEDWNAKLRDMLTSSQLKDGSVSGSWSPERPSKSKWGDAGGRHYMTCLNLLMLEVYYRHLPLYIELED